MAEACREEARFPTGQTQLLSHHSVETCDPCHTGARLDAWEEGSGWRLLSLPSNPPFPSPMSIQTSLLGAASLLPLGSLKAVSPWAHVALSPGVTVAQREKAQKNDQPTPQS